MPGHAQADGSTAGGELAHGFQFLRGGGQGGLDRGDLAEPALVPGLLEPVGEVRADRLQARHLGRVNPEEGTSDTGLRCPLLRPDPAQRNSLLEICGNLTARIAEAESARWLGEAEGLKVSLAGARHKLAQMDEITARRGHTVGLGIPAFPDVAGRAVTTMATLPASEEPGQQPTPRIR